MRKTWILAGAVLVVAVSAMEAGAHGKGGGRGMGMGPGFRGAGPRVSLGTQLGLSTEQQTQFDALKATFEEKEQALRDEEQAAAKALLTEEQKTALDADATAGRGHHRGPVINLSAGQQAQLKALRTEYRDKEQALHTEFEAAFEAMLTADQKGKLTQLRAAGLFGMCIGAGAGAGTSTGTSTATASLSSAKTVAADGEPATGDQSTSWGQLKNADSE